jgi:guanylate kinase
MTDAKIIEDELAKLKAARFKIKAQSTQYIDQHPELRDIIDDFMCAAIARKPADVVEFGWEFFTDMRNLKLVNSVPMIVFVGPTTVGKTTVISELLKNFPTMFGTPILHTSRPANPGEVAGKDYYFETPEIFEQAIAQDEFLLHYGDPATGLYGLSYASIENVRTQGKICLGEMKVEQAVLCRSNGRAPCKCLFLNPPSTKELEHRIALRDYGKRLSYDDEDAIHKRARAAADDIAYGSAEGSFDAVIDTLLLDDSIQQIMTKLQDWFPLIKFVRSSTSTAVPGSST